MRKLRFIWIVLFAITLANACSRMGGQTAALNIYIRLPEEVTTKVGASEWPSILAKEKRINDLKIWVFVNQYADSSVPAGALLGYLEPKQLNVADGDVQVFTLPMDKEKASKLQKVDVFVLANSKAVQLMELGEEATRTQLDTLCLSDNRFGILSTGAPTDARVEETEGLPYCAVGKGLELSGPATNLTVKNVELVRAVSKIQFVFEQGNDTPDDFTITGLELKGSQIPKREYLFNDSNNSYKIDEKSGYVDQAAIFTSYLPAKTSIARSKSPGNYIYTGGSTATYQNRIYSALANGFLTGCPPFYLRESDKTLSGIIRYQIGSESKSLEFNMADKEQFTRNSNWILYFYFNSTTMGLGVFYSEWGSDGPYTIIGN